MRWSLLKATALCALTAVPAQALDVDDVVSARILQGARNDSGQHVAAIEIWLAPGWKTYWRAPGEAGIPPRFDWSESQNIGAVRPHWPVPAVYWINGFRSIGYEDLVTVPLLVSPGNGSDPMRLVGDVEIGVCEEVCIPVSLRVDADLSTAGDTLAPQITAALSDRPMRPEEARVASVTCSVAPVADGMRVAFNVVMPPLGGAEEAVVEFADPTVWITAPVTTRTDGALQVEAELIPPSEAPFTLARDGLRLTLFGDAGAVDIQGCSAG